MKLKKLDISSIDLSRLKYITKLYSDFYDKIKDKYVKYNKFARIKANKSIDHSRNISSKIEDEVLKNGGLLGHNENGSYFVHGTDLRTGKDAYGMNIDPNSDDSSSAHEFQHMKNHINGEHPGSKYDRSDLMFKRELKQSLMSPNRILDYSNNVLQEELSANRGRVMNAYLYGDNIDDETLSRLQKKSDQNQDTYTSLVSWYNPPSNRYNMDKDAYNNLMKNLKK